MFKTYKDKINLELIGKVPQNYDEMRDDLLVYEQKTIKIDDFNKAEKKDIKEHVDKKEIKKERSCGK